VEALRDPPVEEWLGAVTTEVGLTAAEQGWELPLTLDTLYVGGGTPSLLGSGTMASLRDRLASFARLAPDVEWTCEANPESFTAQLARDWRAAGVNRLSLGAQTFDADALRWMGRLHGPDGPQRALDAARGAGFENVSIDLIFGLPGRLERDWAADLERVIAMRPEHVSLYGLTAEAGAPLGRWVREGKEVLAEEDRYADEYLLANRLLTGAGFEHYEVSNFGLPGRHSRHNHVYWKGAPYAALGPGSHAFYPPKRRWNLRSWSAYRETLEAKRLPLAGEETIDLEARDLERVWLGLRTHTGLELAAPTNRQRVLIEGWTARGLAEVVGDVVRLTPAGWLLLDEMSVELQEAGAPAGRRRGRRSVIDAHTAPVQIGATSTSSRR
jgi:oxygen-independent coproporphyrinogen-3 oxidase